MKRKIVAAAAIIMVICALALVLTACNNAQSIENRLVKAGYQVGGDYLGGEAVEMDEDVTLGDVMWALYAYKETEDGSYYYVTLYSFDKNSQAKAALDYFTEYYKDSEGYAVKKSGKIVAAGSEEAVKIAL